MAGQHDPPRLRLGQRLPSGPRPLGTRAAASNNPSSSLDNLTVYATDDTKDAIPVFGQSLTTSPEHTPPVATDTLVDPFSRAIAGSNPTVRYEGSNSHPGSDIAPDDSKAPRQATTSSDTFTKTRPVPLRIDTASLLPPPSSSPKKAVSPSLKHWQQVRSYVLATPAEETGPSQSKSTKGIVGKAAARLGFRHTTESLPAYDGKRISTVAALGGAGLSDVEKAEISRERRRFARDVRHCLDACSVEETRRRLQAMAGTAALPATSAFSTTSSPYAPLLTELHKYLPAARARKAWCRTCPHHASILAELSTAFLPDSTATTGERQQALEVFGVIVRTWSADSADEELSRWLWLCRALRAGDRQLRNRGFPLLSSFLHRDPALPPPLSFPTSAQAFQALASALLELLRAVDDPSSNTAEHRQNVLDILGDMSRGDVVSVDEATVPEGAQYGSSASTSGLETELLWSAIARTVRSDSMVEWLFSPDNPTLLRFALPPILHATPPTILQLRKSSATTFLVSISPVVPRLTPHVLEQVYGTLQDLIVGTIDQLPSNEGVDSLHVAAGTFMIACIRSNSHASKSSDSLQDPFGDVSGSSIAIQRYLNDLAQRYDVSERWGRGIDQALAHEVDVSEDMGSLVALFDNLASKKALEAAFSKAMQVLLKRLESRSEDAAKASDFLRKLSRTHPQLFYKPLFSLAASASSQTAMEHLYSVRCIATAIGSSEYWLEADPQMLVMVLTGQSRPMKSKGKGKEGEVELVNIRVGKYAVLIEFLLALGQPDRSIKPNSRFRRFIEAVEEGIGGSLQSQIPGTALPVPYRALLCVLLHRFRFTTRSSKPAEWQRIVLQCYVDTGSSAMTKSEPGSAALAELAEAHRTLRAKSNLKATGSQRPRRGTSTFDAGAQASAVVLSDPLYPLLHPDPQTAACDLLALLHSAWTLDDWSNILPRSWSLLEPDKRPDNSLLFLIAKCGEIVPAQLGALAGYELQHTDSHIRIRAIRKIANLYTHRHHVLDTDTIKSQKGLLFQFPQVPLDFVLTDIGSPNWSPPQDPKQEALQKYGSAVPLHVRQQLVELGWSDDVDLHAHEGKASMPISTLPSRHMLEDGAGRAADPASSRSLARRGSLSAGSDTSDNAKSRSRRAIFPPILWEVAADQADQALGVDASAAALSLELIRLLQRDEPAVFIRAFASRLKQDFSGSLARLHAATLRTTPGFAHAALNVLVGYLKHVYRQSLSPGDYATALTLIATLIPRVSEISLRDIRKNKAENVLLPSSIYEEDGAFKVSRSWQNGQLDVQAAQLLVLAEIVKANPRDVYLAKRMIAHLDVQDSLHNLTFARAWVRLMLVVFGALKREYNDKAELCHFLAVASSLLRLHDVNLPAVTHIMHLFTLCSARFRRLFAAVGCQAVAPSILAVYSRANGAARDCIEYSMRGFYRIHEEIAVHQTCLAVAQSGCDPAAAYGLLSSMSDIDAPDSGLASGIRLLNREEERTALTHMMLGPEIALSDTGRDRAQRQAAKLAEAAYASRHFPKEDIVRLFVTVIATDPLSNEAIIVLRLFEGMVPFITDERSRTLLGDGMEALGDIVCNQLVERKMASGNSGSEKSGWAVARTAYLKLLEAWCRTNGRPSALLTKSVCSMAAEVIQDRYQPAYAAICALFASLARVHLTAPKQSVFLKHAAAVYFVGLGRIDLSGFLAEVTAWICRSEYEVEVGAARIILDNYLRPAIRLLSSPSIDGYDRSTGTLQKSVVDLLSAMMFASASTVEILEDEKPSSGLLMHIALPLVTGLETPAGPSHAQRASSTWIQLLHVVLRRRPEGATSSHTSSVDISVLQYLRLQVVKVICIRATAAIDAVAGLWTYLAHHIANLLGTTSDLDRHANHADTSSLQNLMRWSAYELFVLHRTPLLLYMRSDIEAALASISHRPEDPATNLPRRTSDNVDSDIPRHHTQVPQDFMPSPEQASISTLRLSHQALPHTRLSRLNSPGRTTPTSEGGPAVNCELSLRERYRRYASQSSQHPGGALSTGTKKAVDRGKRENTPLPAAAVRVETAGGAMQHLLSASNQVLTAASGRSIGLRRGDNSSIAAGEHPAASVHLRGALIEKHIRRAQIVCRVMMGHAIEIDKELDPIRPWTAQDAIREIAEETHLLLLEGFLVPSSVSAQQMDSEDPSLPRLEEA